MRYAGEETVKNRLKLRWAPRADCRFLHQFVKRQLASSEVLLTQRITAQLVLKFSKLQLHLVTVYFDTSSTRILLSDKMRDLLRHRFGRL